MIVQWLICGVLIAAAVGYLGLALYRTIRPGKDGCGGCGSGCGTTDTAATPTFVPRDALTVRPRRPV